MIRTVNDLDAYKRSKRLYPEVIAASATFPPQGYHLRDQMCRSANAIHSDMTEGFGRSIAEFKMYLTRSLGSCNETISHIQDAMNVYWMKQDIGQHLADEYTIVGKQTYQLREHWK